MSEAVQLVVGAAAVVVALTILGKFALLLWRGARGLEEMANLVNHELRPNGGGSLKDEIGRIDRHTQRHDQRLDTVESNAIKAHGLLEDVFARLGVIERRHDDRRAEDQTSA